MSVTGLSIDGEAPAPLKRRSPRTRLIVLLVILFALLAGIYAYLNNYQPVYSPGALGVPPIGFVQWPSSQPGISPERAAELEALVGPGSSTSGVTFDSPPPGFQFGFANLVLSNGPIPVKIVDVQAALWEGSAKAAVPYRVVDAAPVALREPVTTIAGQPSGVKPLAPFSISQTSKNVPQIGVQFTVPQCADQLRHYTKSAVLYAHSFYVTYKYLWFSHKVLIGVPPRIAVVAPFDCGTAAK
jgi:hypothetical protein